MRDVRFGSTHSYPSVRPFSPVNERRALGKGFILRMSSFVLEDRELKVYE
jgi:hypothetical protein